jgi:hypothetical protein
MANGLGELEMELELEGLGEAEGEFQSEFEGEFESEFEGEFESEFETEGEPEFEFESEFEEMINPISRVYPDAMMEHLGLAAMEAESEFEAAEHFLPLIPLVASKLLPIAAKALPRVAGKVIPRVARVITRATPRLTRSVAKLTRTLHRDPRKRHLVRVIPSVARRAVTAIAKHAAAGRPVPPQRAVQILARENRRILGNPNIVRSVLRRSNRMDRQYHRLGGPSYRVGGVPVTSPRMHPHVVGLGRRALFCPTCGTPFRQGVRRVCCCC